MLRGFGMGPEEIEADEWASILKVVLVHRVPP